MTCDHVEQMTQGNLECAGCGKELTMSEWNLKISREIVILEEMIRSK